MFSTLLIILINIVGHVSSNPLQESSSSATMDNFSSEQAFRKAEKVLNRYYHLIASDLDHLVHGMLHVLLNNPKSFPYIPYRAMQIALKNVEQKLGHDEMEDFTKPLLLTVEDNYQDQYSKQIAPVKLPDEVKVKIEETLDKFFHETALNNRPL